MKISYSKLGVIISSVALVAALALVKVINYKISKVKNAELETTSIPYEFNSWKGVDTQDLDNKTLSTLKLDNYIRRLYTNENGESVFVYLGYWKKQSGDHQAAKHSPLLCLPGNGWKISEIKNSKTNISLDTNASKELNYKTLVGLNHNHYTLFGYWFFSGDHDYSEETFALAHIIKETILNHRSDGGIIELSVDIKHSSSREAAQEQAEKILNGFIQDFYPQLHSLIKTHNIPTRR